MEKTQANHNVAQSEEKRVNIITRCGRYALLSRKNSITPFIVACGYDDKTGEWNQGYYFCRLSNAAKAIPYIISAKLGA